MSYKSILVHVQPDPHTHPRLDCAAALARNLDAVLFGLAAEMIPASGVADPYGFLEGQWIVAMREQLDKNLQTSEQVFGKATSGLKTDWRAVMDYPTKAMARAARAADLVVAGGAPLHGQEAYRACDLGELVVTCGRPVLVAPPSGGTLQAKRVVLAWKDTREARRAAIDALPFLQKADEVLVQEVCRQDDAEAAEFQTGEVVRHLERHGVKARAAVVVAPDDRAAAELKQAAQALGADLIVAGGYGHNRMSEWVFGGVTREFLSDPDRFVLLCH